MATRKRTADALTGTVLIKHLPHPALVVDLTTGDVVLANTSWQSLFGWNDSDSYTIHAEDDASDEDPLLQVLRSMCTDGVDQQDLTFSHSTGKSHVHLHASRYDESGLILITAREDTELQGLKSKLKGLQRELKRAAFSEKQSEHLIREAEDRFNSLFNNLDEGVVLFDPLQQRATMSNDGLLKLLGTDPAGANKLEIATDFLLNNRHLNPVFKVLKEDGPSESKETILLTREDNSAFHAEIKSSRINLDRKPFLMLVVRDITEELDKDRKEKQSRFLEDYIQRFKSDFISNLSHETRTRVNSAMGMINFLLETNLDDQQQEFAQNIRQSAGSLLEVINGMLDISKLESGELELKPTVFSLVHHRQEVLNMYESMARQNDIELQSVTAMDVPDMVKADEIRLTQVLSNLLDNAVKFTRSGVVTVRTSMLHKQGKKATIKIEVADSGRGMSQEDLVQLFRSLKALDPMSYQSSGTNMGLVIAHHLVQLMHGEMGAESVLGKGSNFWVTFQTEVIAQKKAVTAPPPEDDIEEADHQLANNPRALVVEDEPLNQMVVKLMLENFGCEVELASNGLESVEMFEPGKYQYIFMDIQMPIMDGIEATHALRKKYFKDELPPIIGVSANAMEGD
ncbi:MAG: ATP-binding protein, partial [Bacteroidota bacterium]